MYTLLRQISIADYASEEMVHLLDSHFHPEYVTTGGTYKNDKLLSLDESLDDWGETFRQHMPWAKYNRLRYICKSTIAYSYQNHWGRACQKVVWPVFFQSFPRGKILILQLEKPWFNSIWNGQFDHAKNVKYKEQNPMGMTPQEMTGLQADSFPFNVLHIGALGIYPLILYDFEHADDLTFIYLPDSAIKHSQMTEPGAFRSILWRLHHVYDDQWTFDGTRGPKSSASDKYIKPCNSISFIQWIIAQISNRMKEILSISDVIRREQLAMTFSRATYDAILAVNSQLPYMSKVFFFACLDKLANMVSQFKSIPEIDAWKQLVDLDFLEEDVAQLLTKIPSQAGEYLHYTLEWITSEMRVDNITADILRDFRNSHHGYALRSSIVDRMYKHSGELNNDLTLIATPLLLYILSQQWI